MVTRLSGGALYADLARQRVTVDFALVFRQLMNVYSQ